MKRQAKSRTDYEASAPIKPRPQVELRKRGEERVERILAAATEVFLEKGYRNARLSDIVAKAGGSLATLYRVFGDKEGLAHAIMARSIRAFGEDLDELLQSPLPPEQALVTAAEHMLDEFLTPERIVTHRIVLAEGLQFPELRDWFFAYGVETAEHSLTEYFTREMDAGRLRPFPPELAASQFFPMVFGTVIIHSASGRMDRMSQEQLREGARKALSIFLHGMLPISAA
ncbi:hypothetical protein CSC70_08200 [Pseudoxanthomonas kalamensis DSM 18571]|uniref:TetR/AcrR family transcriptional regulator n=1 Tax=Pseudoxanthomonas kalamensis TaxID=289483 RepID=UPI001391FF25|nr:TetR/AcrR family transcriptional regulator [Pseudoxanthomonas kalamensis]KAF1710625.1 hypothetical protein CSC70_08200 [Pseudoxanthomonas kalamensis DSM 18571]